ncbi:MAG: hypothetical protein KAQ98_08335 [Bacteriovoracaceae bacterium]|nr:hypothetical protein [Bacteriovoracaceae bacterium]
MFIKSTKFLFLPTLLLMFFQNFIFARPGIVVGDGGTIAELRAGTADLVTILTIETLKELEEENFYSIKEHYLISIAKYASPSDISKTFKNAKETFTTMTKNRKLLVKDMWTTVMENGKCSDRATACTTSYKKFSKITIDFEQVVDEYMDVAELIGLLMHEFSHHFAGEADHEEGNMPLGKYFQRYVLKNDDIKGVVFKGYDLIHDGDYAYASISGAGLKFCQRQGYNAVDLDKSVVDKRYCIKLWKYADKAGHVRTWYAWDIDGSARAQWIYTKIVCR